LAILCDANDRPDIDATKQAEEGDESNKGKTEEEQEPGHGKE
jgi:hypothetical protein